MEPECKAGESGVHPSDCCYQLVITGDGWSHSLIFGEYLKRPNWFHRLMQYLLLG